MSSSRIWVYPGMYVDPIHPTVDDIDIRSIAHALSLQCRFGGHVNEFYSVAEHSVRASWVVPEEYALEALLHDASEAYLVDVPRPIKHDLFGDRYREVEDRLMACIAEKYGIPAEMSDWVRYADDQLLATEGRDLLDHEISKEWTTIPPLVERILPMPPQTAERTFLLRFTHLTGGKYGYYAHAV